MNFAAKLNFLQEQLAEQVTHKPDSRQEHPGQTTTIIETFNSMEFNSENWERRVAADEIAKTMFQHIQKPIEDGAIQFDIHLRREYRLDHTSDDTRSSQAILNHHGPGTPPTANHLLAQAELDHRREKYADTLYESDAHPDNQANHELQMEKALLEPMTYPDDHLENHQDKLFEWLKENRDTFAEKAIEPLIRATWFGARITAQQARRDNQDYNSDQLLSTITLAYKDKIMGAIQENDPTSFKQTINEMPEGNARFSEEFTNHTGFSLIPQDQRPEFPDEIQSVSQMEQFDSQIKEMAHNYLNPEHFPNPDVATAVLYKINEFNKELEYQRNVEEELPERILEPSFNPNHRFNYCERLVQNIKYMTNPQEP